MATNHCGYPWDRNTMKKCFLSKHHPLLTPHRCMHTSLPGPAPEFVGPGLMPTLSTATRLTKADVFLACVHFASLSGPFLCTLLRICQFGCPEVLLGRTEEVELKD